MPKRFVTIWFRYLQTDWLARRRPALSHTAFILAAKDRGRIIVAAANPAARQQGIETGMMVADAKAIYPGLEVIDDMPENPEKLLTALAKYCIRFSPVVAVDLPDGLIMDASGCTSLWGGEEKYLTDIHTRFKNFGYHVKTALADTIGAAWAMAHYSKESIIAPNQQHQALLPLSPAALRLSPEISELLGKLGIRQIKDFISMPRSALRRRFGDSFLLRLDQVIGHKEEIIRPVEIPEPWLERLPCLELITTVTGIEIALRRLLETICLRLRQEEKGLRSASFRCYRIDGKLEEINIGTSRPTCNAVHLFKLFELKLPSIEPAWGIELFTLDASKTEDLSPAQEKLWEVNCGLDDPRFAELIDRLAGKIGANSIHRYLPDQHYWPERSFRLASSLTEKSVSEWRIDRPRPLYLLAKPEPIQVTAPIPDYPPMLFRYKGKLHTIKKADGPDRIEREWWLEEGPHRDYYSVEDEAGCRYWLFRSGHYTNDGNTQWFIHGFFA